MEFKTLRYEKEKAQRQIVYVTLNRPEKSNAISISSGAFHKFYQCLEEAPDQTKYFRSYRPHDKKSTAEQ